MNKYPIVALLVLTLWSLCGCHPDLSFEERMFGVSFGGVYADFASREPDRVRKAVNRFGYIELPKAEPGSEQAENNEKVARSIMTIFTRTLLGQWGYESMDEDLLLRVEAARSIGRRPDLLTDDALQALMLKLDYREENEKFVRIECTRSLGKLHRENTAAPLVQALHVDPEAQVRMTAARALAKFTAFEYDRPDYEVAVQGLIDALSDREIGVRQEAVAALAALTEQRFNTVEECVAWSQTRQPVDPSP